MKRDIYAQNQPTSIVITRLTGDEKQVVLITAEYILPTKQSTEDIIRASNQCRHACCAYPQAVNQAINPLKMLEEDSD